MLKAILISNGKAEQVQVENDLSALQAIVGGYLEYCQDSFFGYAILCDEDGRAKGLFPSLLPKMGFYAGVTLRGNCLIVGYERGNTDFVDVPQHVLDSFNTLFEVL